MNASANHDRTTASPGSRPLLPAMPLRSSPGSLPVWPHRGPADQAPSGPQPDEHRLAGLWRGRWASHDGEDRGPVQLGFDRQGQPLLETTGRSSVVKTVLSQVGQVWRLLDGRGGLSSYRLEALSLSADSVRYQVAIHHERLAYESLHQEAIRYTAAFSRHGLHLDGRLEIGTLFTVDLSSHLPPVVPMRTLLSGRFERG